MGIIQAEKNFKTVSINIQIKVIFELVMINI